MKSQLVITLLLFTAFVIGNCSGEGEQQKNTSGEMNSSGDDHTAHNEMKMEASEPTDESIYNVNSVWQNRHGDSVELNDLGGKVQVTAMVYTHCEHACPRILADLKRIRDALSAETLSVTNFTIISIDHERDTPSRLTDFANENDLTEDKWTLLNRDQGDILELAALLGVKYKRISDTDFTHSNMITVLNQEGKIIHQRKQLADQQTKTINSIETLITD